MAISKFDIKAQLIKERSKYLQKAERIYNRLSNRDNSSSIVGAKSILHSARLRNERIRRLFYDRQTQSRLLILVQRLINKIIDYAQEYGPYQNITGKLRGTLTYRIYELKNGGISADIYAPATEYRKSGPRSYAAYVEFHDNYWVLSGALYEYKDKISKIFKQEIKSIMIEIYNFAQPEKELGGKIKYNIKSIPNSVFK